jgi:hypothetical protein
MKIEHRKTIARGMNFPMERVLERYTAEYLASLDDAKMLERELKRFLILCAMDPTKKYVMGGRVDDLWHTFLLFTQQYARFCAQLAGHFIHHVPTDPKDGPAELGEWQNQYAMFLRDYQKIFGESPPASIWPALEPPTIHKKVAVENGRSGRRRLVAS